MPVYGRIVGITLVNVRLLLGAAELRVVSSQFDAFVVHLVAAAVQRGADVICSANRRHLPEGQLAGDLQVKAA